MSKSRRYLAAFFAAALASIGLAASAAQFDNTVATSTATKQLTDGLSVTSQPTCAEALPAQYASDGVMLKMSSNLGSVQYGKYHGAAPNGVPIMRTSSPSTIVDSRTATPEIILTSISGASQEHNRHTAGQGHHDASTAGKFAGSQPFTGTSAVTT